MNPGHIEETEEGMKKAMAEYLSKTEEKKYKNAFNLYKFYEKMWQKAEQENEIFKGLLIEAKKDLLSWVDGYPCKKTEKLIKRIEEALGEKE